MHTEASLEASSGASKLATEACCAKKGEGQMNFEVERAGGWGQHRSQQQEHVPGSCPFFPNPLYPVNLIGLFQQSGCYEPKNNNNISNKFSS